MMRAKSKKERTTMYDTEVELRLGAPESQLSEFGGEVESQILIR